MFEIALAGENSIIIYFNDAVSPQLSKKIAACLHALEQKLSHVLIDKVPSYQSLMLSYRADLIQHAAFCQQVVDVLNNEVADLTTFNAETITIPVYYAEETGLDLSRLLTEKSMSLSQLIALHSQQDYFVYAIGFSPAFAFLGHVDAALQTPRLTTPRIKIPAGSVGIADNQTAVYPIDSAGGWNIIGRTPLDLSLNNADSLQRFQVGQLVRFEPITRQQYVDLGGQL